MQLVSSSEVALRLLGKSLVGRLVGGRLTSRVIKSDVNRALFCAFLVRAEARIDAVKLFIEAPIHFRVVAMLLGLMQFASAESCIGQIELLVEPTDVAASAWRQAQLDSIAVQLASTGKSPLHDELTAQQRWLKAWQPGSLSEEPLWGAPPAVAKQKVWKEPSVDPAGLASDLRAKLIGEGAKPTGSDTAVLRKLLAEHPRDLGIRQLHLHWLDQYVYRKQYPDEIATSAEFVLKLLDEAQLEKATKDRAVAFTMYRRARALAYRELPEVVAKQPLDDPEAHAERLLGAAESLFQFAGKGRQEFILLEIRMLRKKAMYGQALALIEGYGRFVDRKWALKKRRDTLADLGWKHPQQKAADIYRAAFPDLDD